MATIARPRDAVAISRRGSNQVLIYLCWLGIKFRDRYQRFQAYAFGMCTISKRKYFFVLVRERIHLCGLLGWDPNVRHDVRVAAFLVRGTHSGSRIAV